MFNLNTESRRLLAAAPNKEAFTAAIAAMKIVTLHNPQNGKYMRTEKPRIRRNRYDTWHCFNGTNLGAGYTPQAAYDAWFRNTMRGLRNPQ